MFKGRDWMNENVHSKHEAVFDLPLLSTYIQRRIQGKRTRDCKAVH
jgi:hypothetical protein